MNNTPKTRMENGGWMMAKTIALFAILYPLSSILCFGTQVLFPLSQMFAVTNYANTFQIKSTAPLITDNTRVYVGSFVNVTPTPGTDPVVSLTPNDYLVTFSDASTPWRISVPNSPTVLNALNLTAGPLPTFQYSPPGIGTATNLTAGATNQVAAIVQAIAVTNTQTGVTLTGTFGGTFAGDANNTTNIPASAIINQPVFVFDTFQAGSGAGANYDTNGVWSYVSLNLTNGWMLSQWFPFWRETNTANGFNVNLRDIAHFCFTDNAGKRTFLLTATTHYGDDVSSATPGFDMASSSDDFHWAHLAFIYPTNTTVTNSWSVWSPKLFVDATNGLWATCLMGTAVAGSVPTNVFLLKLSEINFTNFSTCYSVPVGGLNIGGGCFAYFSPYYYYFNKHGIKANTNLGQSGWNEYFATDNTANDGSTVINVGGVYYWFQTDGSLSYDRSLDLTNWTYMDGQGNGQPHTVITPFQEGTILVLTNALNPASLYGPVPGSPPPAGGGGGGGTVPNGLVTNSAPANIVVTNAGVNTTITSNSVTSGTFNGSGSGLTALPAAQLSGTVPVAALPVLPNAAVTNNANLQTWNGNTNLFQNTITFSNANNTAGGNLTTNGAIDVTGAINASGTIKGNTFNSSLDYIAGNNRNFSWTGGTGLALSQASTWLAILDNYPGGASQIYGSLLASNLYSTNLLTYGTAVVGGSLTATNGHQAPVAGLNAGYTASPAPGYATNSLQVLGTNGVVAFGIDSNNVVNGNGAGLTNLPGISLSGTVLTNSFQATNPVLGNLAGTSVGNGTNFVRVIHTDSGAAALAIGCFTNTIPANTLVNNGDRVLVTFTMDLTSWTQPWSIRLQQATTNILIMNRTSAGIAGVNTFNVAVVRTNNSAIMIQDGTFDYPTGSGNIGQDNSVSPVGHAAFVDFTQPILIWSSNAPANNVVERYSAIEYHPACN